MSLHEYFELQESMPALKLKGWLLGHFGWRILEMSKEEVIAHRMAQILRGIDADLEDCLQTETDIKTT